MSTETLPVPSKANGTEVLKSIQTQWMDNSRPFLWNTWGSLASITYHPLPALVSEATKRYGNNFVNIDDQNNRIILVFDFTYPNGFQSNAEAVDKANQDVFGSARKLIADHIQNKKTVSWATL
jgi:hypothetical protein